MSGLQRCGPWCIGSQMYEHFAGWVDVMSMLQEVDTAEEGTAAEEEEQGTVGGESAHRQQMAALESAQLGAQVMRAKGRSLSVAYRFLG